MRLPSVDPGATDGKVGGPTLSSQEGKPRTNTYRVCHSRSVCRWRARALSLAATSVAADLASTGQATLGVCNCGEGQAGVFQARLSEGEHLGKAGWGETLGGNLWGKGRRSRKADEAGRIRFVGICTF